LETPFQAYRGDDSYVFVCYSHSDADEIYSELAQLNAEGVNVWFDEGIRPGSEWTQELATAIAGCSKFIFFVTTRSVLSRHCRDEVQYALKHGKSIVVVYLEDAELPPGLDLMLGSIQAVIRDSSDRAIYMRRLLEAIWDDVGGDEVAKSGIGHIPEPRWQPHSRPWRTQRKPAMWAAGIIFGLALVALYVWSRMEVSREAVPLPAQINSIAVLPFEDRGGFDDESFYPDSVSEDLLNRLAGLDRLSVASRRSSFRYRLADVEQLGLVEIARRLGVNSVLSGYIRRNGPSIRLSLELIDVSSGREFVRWSHSYNDRPIGDMLAIQAEITRALASELLPDGLSAQTEQRLARQSTSSSEAYEFYLQAKEILREPLGELAPLAKSVSLFSKAIELDPDFAWAKAGLCASNTLVYALGGNFEAARKSCERLIGMDEQLFDVRLALGDYYLKTGKLDSADTELRAAIELNPNSADARISLAELYAERFYQSQDELDRIRAEEAYLEAIKAEPEYWFVYHSYANYLTRQNRFQDALAQMKLAIAIKPTSTATLNNIGNIQYRLGLVTEAEETWKKSIFLNPNNRWAHSGLGIMYHYQRKFDRAVEHLKAACELSPDDHTLWGRLGESYRMLQGGQELAREAFDRAASLAEEDARINPTNWRTAGYLALYYAYLGKSEQAQAKLDLMFELNPGADPMTHYWAALVAYERDDVEAVFTELDLALANGFSAQKQFIEDEPALEALRKAHPARFAELLSRY